MRYIHLDGKYVVFFCDSCGKQLDDSDEGEPFWEDYDKFVQDMQEGKDSEEVKFLCSKCFNEAGGSAQSWYTPENKKFLDSIND